MSKSATSERPNTPIPYHLDAPPDLAGGLDETPRFGLLNVTLFCTVLTGLLVRISAAERFSSHVDESASIMAAQMVAEKGAPIFPSGTLYLQGATISYLLAPFVKLGYGGLEYLTELRMLSVIAGTLAILALFHLTKWLTHSPWTAVGVAAMLAIDPASIRWSGMVRMYALLQLVAIIMLFLFLKLLRHPGSRHLIIAFVAAFWFGVFTHIAICLFVIPMAILAIWKHRLALLGRRFDLTIAMGLACLAPVVLLALNRIVTPPQATPAGTSGGVSFVGDYLLSVDQILNPTAASWRYLFRYADSGAIIPTILICLSFLLFGRYYLDTNLDPAKIERRNIFGSLMLLYWIPILLVASFATESNERYLLHLHPIGLIIAGFAIQELVGGERLKPALSFSPVLPDGSMERFGPTGIITSRFGERVAWLTTSRLITTIGISTVAFGAVVRLWGYNRLSFWLDEGFALLYSKQSWDSAAGLNGFYSPHPPLYFLLTKVFNVFLSDDSAGRTLSVLCGVLVLPAFYLLARRLLDPIASIVATLVFAASPIHIYYSQEARMYSLVVLSVTVTFLALVAFMQTRKVGWAALYGIAVLVAAYGDYSALFVLGPQAVVLAFLILRDWRRMVPIIIAAGLAVLAYVPWLPQVWHSVNSANDDARRGEYLGAGFDRILIILLRITGIASDSNDAYFPSLALTPWDRFQSLQVVMLIAMAPVVVIGAIGLWRRWMAAATVACFLGCVAVAAIISVISPSLAERSVLSASVGWALLLGAAFNGKAHRERTPLAAASLCIVLLLCAGTVQNIHSSSLKSRWNEAAADLNTVSPLQYPVITYSYGTVADTIVEAYEPGLLDEMRVITIRDGQLEKTLSNDNLPKNGITVADVDSEELLQLLPDTPENKYVWYLFYQRIGQENVASGIERAGYTRIMYEVYTSPRNQVFLSLYARPGANPGEPVPLPPFTDSVAWGIPANASLVDASADGGGVAISNQSRLGTAVATQVDAPGAALVTFHATVETLQPGRYAVVTLACLSGTGIVLNELTAETPGIRGELQHTSSVVCPQETRQVRITIRNTSFEVMTFTNASLARIPIPGDT